MGQGALSKPAVQRWLSLNSSREVGSMRGAQSSILESMKWTVQVKRAAIAVRHHVHFNTAF